MYLKGCFGFVGVWEQTLIHQIKPFYRASHLFYFVFELFLISNVLYPFHIRKSVGRSLNFSYLTFWINKVRIVVFDFHQVLTCLFMRVFHLLPHHLQLPQQVGVVVFDRFDDLPHVLEHQFWHMQFIVQNVLDLEIRGFGAEVVGHISAFLQTLHNQGCLVFNRSKNLNLFSLNLIYFE